MKKTLILFEDGNKVYSNSDTIKEYPSQKLVEVFTETATVHDLVSDLGEMIAIGAVKSVNSIDITPMFVDCLGDGWYALKQEIIERFGEDSAQLIFADVKKKIEENKADE